MHCFGHIDGKTHIGNMYWSLTAAHIEGPNINCRATAQHIERKYRSTSRIVQRYEMAINKSKATSCKVKNGC